MCWDNGSGAINLNHVGTTLIGNHTVRNNVVIAGSGRATVSVGGASPVIQRNSWQLFPGGLAPGMADFADVDTNRAMAAVRRNDGGLPETWFMRPLPASRLVDAGIALPGDQISGGGPDLGARETPGW